MCLGLCIGVLVAILAVYVNDHDKRLEVLDSLSTHLGKRVETLTKENEKLRELIEGRFVDYLKVGHAQVLNFQPSLFFRPAMILSSKVLKYLSLCMVGLNGCTYSASANMTRHT